MERKKIIPRLLVITLTCALLLTQTNALPIIPNGTGFGMDTPAGSGRHNVTINATGNFGLTNLCKVVNLDDSPEGTGLDTDYEDKIVTGDFRYCVEKALSPKVIVFEVSGTIELEQSITVGGFTGKDSGKTGSFMTIAGQTAPSPGITIAKHPFKIERNCHDILIQHLRFRLGDTGITEDGANPDAHDAINIGWSYAPEHDPPWYPAESIIIDHCSISWGVDESAQVGGDNCTFTNNIISEGLNSPLHSKGPHSKGLVVSAINEELRGGMNTLLADNLFYKSVSRCPKIAAGSVVVSNNYIHNSREGIKALEYDGQGPIRVSITGNHITNHLSNFGSQAMWIETSPIYNDTRVHFGNGTTYEANYAPEHGGSSEVSILLTDPWNQTNVNDSVYNESLKSYTPPLWPENYSQIPVMQVPDYVLQNAGARPADRDCVDARVISEVEDGSVHEYITSQDDVAGWPGLEENYRTFKVPDNATAIQPSGYTGLEEYLHEHSRIVEGEENSTCGDGICTMLEKEDCGSCPSDCGQCTISFMSPTPDDNEILYDDSITINVTSNMGGEHFTIIDFNHDLLAWWRMEDNLSIDESTYEKESDIVGGVSLGPGRWGNAAYFDGKDDYVTVPHDSSFNPCTGITASAWINPSNVSGGRAIISKLKDAYYKQYALKILDGELRFDYEENGGNYAFSGGTITENEWQHVAFTISDNLNITLWIDGVPVASDRAPESTLPHGDPLVIGRDSGIYNQNYFEGAIDEVMVFGRKLSADEIRTLNDSMNRNTVTRYHDLTKGYAYEYQSMAVNSTGSSSVGRTAYVSTGQNPSLRLYMPANNTILREKRIPISYVISGDRFNVYNVKFILDNGTTILSKPGGEYVFDSIEEGEHQLRISMINATFQEMGEPVKINVTIDSIDYCGDKICNLSENITICPQDCKTYPGDNVLKLDQGGYAQGFDEKGKDLDYSQSFSLEAISIIEPHKTGARHSSFIQKGASRVIWNGDRAGFALGVYYNNLRDFGKRITAKIGDGTNEVGVRSGYHEGYVYSVVTWDAKERKMILYVNGRKIGEDSNEKINLSDIENDHGIQLGNGEGELRRDIFMGRIWNRELSEEEVNGLWTNYSVYGDYSLPQDFSRAALLSEWLMEESCDASGNPGTSYIKDTTGRNNLQMIDNASILFASGYLSAMYPLNGATGIDKSVTLEASGGVGDLGPYSVSPLQYHFQIDEVPTFDSQNLTESGWLLNYAQWSPILKANTTYYWRVKVKDSNRTPKESDYTSVRSFTTEASEDWYLRDPSGNYGDGDGTSFEDAWNYIRDIRWGEDGVEAGDNLYICGDQILHNITNRYFVDTHTEFIEASGHSNEYPITIRMDCPNGKGEFWSAFEDNYQGPPQWSGPDMNGVYRTDNFSVGTPAIEYDGENYILLNRSGNTTWEGGYGHIHNEDGTTYVKTTDGSHPKGKIYSRGSYNILDLGRSSYIRFYRCNFYWSKQNKEKKGTTRTQVPASHDIVYDESELRYGHTLIDLYAGHNNWTIKNSELHDAGNGIYTHTPGNMYNLLVENTKIHDIGTDEFYHKDAHAIGVQNGIGFVIQNNTIWNTGAALEFWSGNYDMKNNTIRYNYIKDVYNKKITSGGGIVISGNTDPEKRHSYYIYGNIIQNPALGTNEDFQGGGITVNIGGDADLHIYNNIVYEEGGSHDNGRGAIRVYNSQGYPLQNVHIYNNIIYEPNYRYLFLQGDGDPWINVSVDNNLYYPVNSSSGHLFHFGRSIEHDTDSVFADPIFVSGSPTKADDFMLQNTSPAIDAGFDVGISHDRINQPIPQDGNNDTWSIPDIGAYEFSKGELINFQCAHEADRYPCDGVLSFMEIQNYTLLWHDGDVPLQSLLEVVNLWNG